MCVRGRVYSSFSYIDKYINLIIKDRTLLRIASAQKKFIVHITEKSKSRPKYLELIIVSGTAESRVSDGVIFLLISLPSLFSFAYWCHFSLI